MKKEHIAENTVSSRGASREYLKNRKQGSEVEKSTFPNRDKKTRTVHEKEAWKEGWAKVYRASGSMRLLPVRVGLGFRPVSAEYPLCSKNEENHGLCL